MRKVRKLRARPLVGVLALATGVVVAVGRLGLKRRGGERRSRMTEANKAIARRVVDEIYNEGKLDVADELYSPEFIGYDPALPEPMRGPDGIKQQVEGYRAAFSDMRLAIEDLIAEGDLVVSRWTARGTHDGELFGIAPTGKQATVTGITIDRIADGRVTEEWNSWDTLGLMQQLGAVPAMAQA